jgi:serine protease
MKSRTVIFSYLSTLLAVPAVTYSSGCANLDAEEASATSESAVSADFDCEWYQKEVGFFDAWQTIAKKADASGKPMRPGEGVMIGVIDTGYLPNPEIMTPAAPGVGVYLPLEHRDRPTAFEVNLVENNNDPLDTYRHSAINAYGNFGHGSSLMSLLLGTGAAIANQNGRVTGVVRYANVLPIRAATGVVLVNEDPGNKTANIRTASEGVIRAVDSGAKVISMSMGALTDVGAQPKPTGQLISTTLFEANAMQHAADIVELTGGIFVASAGQGQSIVVPIPGRLDNVLCVGGSAPGQKPWSDSTRGREVDVSAPAHTVCVSEAVSAVPDARGNLQYRHGVYSGTSYSAVLTSAIAALWLQYHGQAALEARYGARNIGKVFRYIVASQGHTVPAGWDTGGYGVGIIHADRTLRAALPSCDGLRVDQCSDKLAGMLRTLHH